MEALIEQLKRHEGSKKDKNGNHILYKDTVDKWTCGYGRNLSDVGISEDEALYLLRNDIDKARRNLSKWLPWTEMLDRVRYEVLVNMTFNMGIGGLLQFKNTLKLIKESKYKEASIEMLKSRWAKQVGSRAIELSKQMKTGEYKRSTTTRYKPVACSSNSHKGGLR